MAAKVDQKEYLKRYLGGGSDGSKKKKKKKDKDIRGKTVQIIDADLDVGRMQNIEKDDLEVFQTGEDAPQVCGVIDDRPPELIALDFKNSTKWKVISDDNGFESGLIVQETDADGRIRKPGKSGNSQKKSVSFGGSRDEDSSPMPGKRNNSPDLSPVRKGGSPRRNRRDSDESPPRRKGKDSDESPPRKQRRDSDASPPRKRRSSPDRSPPRRGGRGDSDDDLSPIRKRGGGSPDQSPLRRGRDRSRSPQRRRRDTPSPSRRPKQRSRSPRDSRRRKSQDRSPPRREVASSRDLSPPRKNSHRNRSPDQSPPRRKRRDSPSPSSSRSNRQRSPENSRKREKKRWDSPDRPSRDTKSPDFSPRRRNNRDASPGPSNKKMEKTLDGKMAGLQSAKALRVETEAFREREKRMFDQMSAETSGRNAAVVRRDRKTGRIRDMEAEMEKERIKDQKERERKEIYDRWGKGVKQVDEHRKMREAEQHEMSKPLARYAGDDDLEDHLRRQERTGDPMLAYIREKEREKKRGAGQLVTMPRYQGSYPDNRFGIPPGYRWDGVDRSNGYEKKYFDVQSKKKASEEEAYRYSTEDM